MPDRQEAPIVQQAAAVRVGVDVGRVRHVVAGLLDPADEADLPREDGLTPVSSGAVAVVRPIERDLRRVLASGDRRRAKAIERVETFAGRVVIGVVVVRLIGRHGLLVEEGCGPAVVADGEHDVVLVVLRVGQQREIDATGPRGLGGQCVARRPLALDHARGRVGRARGLLDTAERADVLHQARAQPLVPPEPIDVDRVRLCGVDTHVEGDVLTLVDARGGRIALDLAIGIRRPHTADLPLARPGLLILDHDGIVLGRRRRRRQSDSEQRGQANSLQG